MWRLLRTSIILFLAVLTISFAAVWVHSYFVCDSYFQTRDAKVVQGFRLSRGLLLLFQNTPDRPNGFYVLTYLLGIILNLPDP